MTVRTTLQDLIPNTAYVVRVRSLNPSGASEWSVALPFTTITDTNPPNVPTNVTWVATGDSFHGEWDAVTQNAGGLPIMVTTYEVRLVAGATTKVVQVAPGTSSNKNVFDLTFAANQALFTSPQPAITMSVRAVDSYGAIGSYSTGILATNPAPAAPTSVAVTPGADSLDITWTPPADTDLIGYNVYTGTTAGFTPSSGNKVGFTASTRLTYTTTTYSLQYFKVRAVDKFNQESVDSAAASGTPISPFGADTTAPATPTGLSATITTSTSANLATSAAVSWTANAESDLAGYFVRYRVNGTTPWNVVRYDKTQTSAVISNLTPYVNYDFQIAAVDWSENMSAYSGTATGTGASNAAPSTPTAPTVAVNTMQAQVTVPGTKAAGGAMEADVVYYEVYGSTTTGFTPGTTNMLGVIAVGPAMIETFQIPTSGGTSTQTWFFKIIAVDNGGLKSSASAQTSGTPSLIQATNITDATITNAKINDLAANKITAGTGIINNLSVKSILTLGDASTTGSLQSFDYAAGSAGFKMASVAGVASLEINQGSIAAAALKIQAGPNLMPPQYADFEFNPTYYSSATLTATNLTAVSSTAQKLFNTQSLAISPTNATNSVFFGGSNTDYNVVVQSGTTYIISYYARIETGGTAATITPSIKYATATTPGTVAGTGASVPANSTWARYSTTIAIPGTATGMAIVSFSSNTATGTYYLDGIQLEQKLSSITTPSPWAPPGATNIAGDMIRTGSLISQTTTVVNGNTIPFWNINKDGSAQFANLLVRGAAVVGVPNDDDGGASQIASGNYVPGPVETGGNGWIIRSDGWAEFKNVEAESFDGDAIKTNTLSVSKLTAGSLNDEITLASGTNLVAHGLMGEKVGMGDYGFSVNGPQENSITFMASSGTTRTITTAVAHGFIADGVNNNKVNITMGTANANYDGTYIITGTPTTTTFTYTASTSVTQATTAADPNSIVQGQNPGLSDGPVYINFPTDGTQPNIISGQLTATNVTVTGGMSIRQSSQIEQGAFLTINSVIQPPKSAPVVTQGYSDMSFIKGNVSWWKGITKGSNGNYYVGTYEGVQGRIVEFNTSGTFIQTRLIMDQYDEVRGVVYATPTAGSRYYVLRKDNAFSGTGHPSYVIDVYNTSWVLQGSYTAQAYTPTNGWGYSTIGWDFTNNRLMATYRTSNTGGSQIVAYYTLDSVTGIPTAVAGTTTLSTTSGYSDDLNFIGRGDFDFPAGTDWIISTTGTKTWDAWNGTSGGYSGIQWYVANNNKIAGAYWNTTASKFEDINTTGVRRIYEGGDSYWSGVPFSQQRWIRYSYYKSVGDIETSGSPASGFLLTKRARMLATIVPVPGGVGGTLPDSARVYVLNNTTDTYPTTTNYFLRRTVGTGTSLADINPYVITTGTTIQTVNDFAGQSGNPGQIISSTGNSYWKGDDTAQFYQLIVNSGTDVTTTAGNKPALRIGNITGAHLRIDGNEIQAMAGDATTNDLIIQQGGGDTRYHGSIIGLGGTQWTNDGSIHGAKLFADTPDSQSAAANVRFNANNQLVQATSLSKFKLEQEPITMKQAEGLLDLTPITWYDRSEVKENGGTKGLKRIPGVTAEDVEEHAPIFADYHRGKLSSVSYDRMASGTILLIKDHRARIEELEAEVDSLKKALND